MVNQMPPPQLQPASVPNPPTFMKPAGVDEPSSARPTSMTRKDDIIASARAKRTSGEEKVAVKREREVEVEDSREDGEKKIKKKKKKKSVLDGVV